MKSLEKFRYNFSRVVSTVAIAKEDPPATFTKEQLDAAVASGIADATKGLKAKNDELLGDVRGLKDKIKSFDDLDIEGLKALKDKLDKDEDLKLLAEGKHTELLERHTSRMKANHDKELQAEREKTAAETKRADKFRQSVLDNEIRASASGLHPGAVEDALLHARNIFTLDENGKAVRLDEQGRVEMGKDGKSPFSPAEWFEQMKETKSHWFPSQASGSGSGGAREAGGTGKTMKRDRFEALPAHEQAATVKSGTIIID